MAGGQKTLSVPAQNRGRVLLAMNGVKLGRIRAMAGVKKPRLVVVTKIGVAGILQVRIYYGEQVQVS